MTMPEAAMDKHRCVIARKNQIGAPGQLSRMQAEAQARLMQAPAQHHLWLGILATDAAHIELTLLGRENVHQREAVASSMMRCRAAVISAGVIPGRNVTAPK